ncbi:MAG: DUF5668 domain-containing protein [Chloroflexota bacterium]
MTEKRSHPGAGFPVFAALLIVVGVVLLLQNFNVLPDGMWRALWRFWPVILLIIGVNIFLRDRPWLAGLIILLIMLATIGAAAWVAYGNISWLPNALYAQGRA